MEDTDSWTTRPVVEDWELPDRFSITWFSITVERRLTACRKISEESWEEEQLEGVRKFTVILFLWTVAIYGQQSNPLHL